MKIRNEKGQFTAQEATREDLMRIFAKYFSSGNPAQCWEWRGERAYHGYGVCRVRRSGGRKNLHRMAHRLSYEVHHGPIPVGHHVCHKCDNPLCVNPNHLFTGTDRDNSDDKVRKGRQSKGESHGAIMKIKSPKGERCYAAKFTDADIPDVFDLRSKGCTYKEIASIYGVDLTCIYKIIKGKRWKHLGLGVS